MDGCSPQVHTAYVWLVHERVRYCMPLFFLAMKRSTPGQLYIPICMPSISAYLPVIFVRGERQRVERALGPVKLQLKYARLKQVLTGKIRRAWATLGVVYMVTTAGSTGTWCPQRRTCVQFCIVA